MNDCQCRASGINKYETTLSVNDKKRALSGNVTATVLLGANNEINFSINTLPLSDTIRTTQRAILSENEAAAVSGRTTVCSAPDAWLLIIAGSITVAFAFI